MVIGNGALANCFKKEYSNNDSIIIFASGVSNSNEKKISEFEREQKLLMNTLKTIGNKKLVYFSSVFVEIIDNEYYKHKKNIESIIKNNCKNYLILRLPQVISESGNEKNLINFLNSKIQSQVYFEIEENITRSIVDIEDVRLITTELLKTHSNKIFKLASIEKVLVSKICEKISSIKNKPLLLKLVPNNKKMKTTKNSSEINKIIKQLNIDKKNYTTKVLKKYIKL